MYRSLVFLIFGIFFCQLTYATDLILFERKDKDSPTGIFIPSDLKEAVRELSGALDTDFKEDLQSRPLFMLHSFETYELEDWMIESWALEEGSKLAQYFEAKGFKKTRSMASAVLNRWVERQQGIYTAEDQFLKDELALEASMDEFLKLPPNPDGSPPEPPPFRD